MKRVVEDFCLPECVDSAIEDEVVSLLILASMWALIQVIGFCVGVGLMEDYLFLF